MSDETSPGRRSRLKLAALIAVAALVLFTALGFLAAPPIVKSILVKKASALLGRQVALGKVRVNPYTLSVSIEDLRVADTDGEALASWRRLFVDFEIVSLFGHDWVFKEISVAEPYGRLVILKDGSLNVSDVVARLRASSPAEPSAKPSEPKGVRIGRLTIDGARFGFSDLSRPEPFATVLGPLKLELDAFSTRPDSQSPYTFVGSTERGERFAWSGTVGIDPLRSTGEVSLENFTIPRYKPYYLDRLPFRVKDGYVSVKASYAVEWSAAKHLLGVEKASLAFRSLDIVPKGSDESVVAVPALEIADASVDLLTGAARIGSVKTSGGSILVRREAGGKIGLVDMLEPLLSGPSSSAPLTVGPVSVSGYTVKLEDRAAPQTVEAALSNLAIDLKGYDAAPGTAVPFAASFSWTESGTVRLEGATTSSFDRAEVKLSVADFALRPLAPYVEPYLSLYVTEGKLGAEGTVRYGTEGGKTSLGYRGSLSADGVASIDAAFREDLVRGASFRIEPIDFSLDPLALSIGTIDATRPFLRWIVNEDGTNNILRVFKVPPEGSAPAPAPAGPTAKIAIGKFRIREGRLDFTDRLVKPNVAMSIAGLSGEIAGLSSEELSRADVRLEGKVDGYAPFGISGKINPLIENQATDLKIEGKGIELTTLGPYSGKYLGYGIRKGKLDLDLAYKVESRKLDARNVITIDQLELGEKTESEEAVKLPVKLAIALLRDRNGRIVLDVPVDGDLGDPEFHMRKVIWRAIRNTLTKIVTSPFTLLAHAFGGKEEELARFDFLPGESAVTPEAASRLDPIVKALYERPGLSLEIAGIWDETADTAALKRQRLDRLVRDAKWKALRAKDPALASPDAVKVLPEEYPAYLKAAYDERFPPPPPAPPPPPPKKGEPAPPPVAAPAPPSTEEMANRLRESIPVTPDDLRLLAADRAKSVRDAIVATGKVETARVFLVESGKAAEAGQGPRAEFTLK